MEEFFTFSCCDDYYDSIVGNGKGTTVSLRVLKEDRVQMIQLVARRYDASESVIHLHANPCQLHTILVYEDIYIILCFNWLTH